MLGSCLNDDSTTPNQQLLEDIEKIDAYLAANPPAEGDLLVKDARSGIRMVITERPEVNIDGTEPIPLPPTLEDIIRVGYVGRRLNGAQFDEDESYTFTLTTADAKGKDVIEGWKFALSMMTQGMKATVYIPSGLAYGPRGKDPIPGNAILVFDLDLKEVDTSDEETQARFAADKNKISAKLEGVPNVVVHPNGISYILQPLGSGARPDMYDHVKVKYTGKLLDGTVFAQDIEQGPVNVFSSRPANYIHGLALGLQLMNQGDKATFYIPSVLGYGPNGQPGIPANANLIFEIELLEVIPNMQ